MAEAIVSVTAKASAAQGLGTVNGDDLTNFNGKGVLVTLDVTAVSGTTPTLDVKLQHKDSVSGKYVDIPGASFTQKTGISTDTLLIYPSITVTANRQVNSTLGKLFRIVSTVGGTATPIFTFSVGVDLLG